MILIGTLILLPLVVAILLLLLKQDGVRNALVCVAAAAIAVLSVALAISYLRTGWIAFSYSSEIVNICCTVFSVLLAVAILSFSIKYKNILVTALAVIQLAGSLVFEFVYSKGIEVQQGLYIDSLSVIMALIIGIIGSGITVYALGYMIDFQHHEPEGAKDRRNIFFAIMYLFLSAMFVIVFANNLSWLFTGWEITTVCSFLLIGYTKTEEAINNAFRQIIFNMLGGIGFLVALYWCAINLHTLDFAEFIKIGLVNPSLVAVPVGFLAFAGLTKAAQMPFHTWLLGAMVAPTPTSALLHSSTMVKAGVFLLIKLAPLFLVCPAPAIMVILVGGITFVLCSFMAISQSNAKRVLAYSTIANLGLIVACAGVGTAEAIWAAILLTIFHAAAKSLLFLCVGTAEHHIGSRDIESMDLLFDRMPRLARLMMLGIMCMFVAPFGMLIAKWATLVSFVETGNVALIILLAFGSAATFMFWAKWLGKLSGIAGEPQNVELSVHKSEWAALLLMAGLVCVTCVLLPIMSSGLVVPYIQTAFHYGGQDISDGNLWIAAICAVLVILMLFAGLGRSSKQKKVDVYLAGASADNAARAFRGSLSAPVEATSRNMYLDGVFGEARIAPIGSGACIVIMVAAIAWAAAMLPGLL